MNALEIRGLSKSFEGLVAVDDVTFNVAEGEILALIGANGAGKSTTFNLVNGQLKPDAGSVRLFGAEIAGLSPRAIACLGVARTFQITRIFGSMSVRENVQAALIARRGRIFDAVSRGTRFARDDADRLLDRVGIAGLAGNPSSTLAYGDLKRLELAIALAGNPRLLLMDEPTAGMAPGERAALMELVGHVVEEAGIAVLFTEHDMEIVFGHADRIVVMDRGRVIAEGSPEAIRADPAVRNAYLGAGLAESSSQDAPPDA